MTDLSAIILVLIGSSLWGIGTVFFKRATMSADAIDDADKSKQHAKNSTHKRYFPRLLMNKNFIAGGALSIIGWVIYLPGLSMGEASVVGPLAAMAYISEVSAARLLIDERISRIELLGILTIIVGIIIIGLQGA
jgi:drug/metabolite transporter (DMT)-like permease